MATIKVPNGAVISIASVEQHTMQTKWRLSEDELDLCAAHFLRNWTASELQEVLEFESNAPTPTITLWGVRYTICSEVRHSLWYSLLYATVKGRNLIDPMNDKPIKFWLSFRHGRDSSGAEFAYVIVQEDKK